MRPRRDHWIERSLVLFQFGAIIFSLSAFGAEDQAGAKRAQSSRKNVLFIISDDLRATGPLYHEPEIFTPRLERLARTSTVFQRAYAQAGACAPSRTSLFTGMRPEYTGAIIMSNDPKLDSGQLRNFPRIGNLMTMPQYFRSQGYASVGIGKTFHIYPKGGDPPDPDSWTEYLKLPPQVRAFHDPENQNRDRKAGFRPPAVEGYDAPESNYVDAGITEETIKFLKRAHEKPFFMVVGYQKPHLAFVAPKKYFDLYPDANDLIRPDNPSKTLLCPPYAIHDSFEVRSYGDAPPRNAPLSPEYQEKLRRGYSACVSFIDEQIGRLMDALETEGLLEHTIVVVIGDNGFHLGDNGFFGKNTNFEQSNKILMMMRIPGVTRGEQVESPVELLDLFPTVVQAAGLPVPPHVQGRNLFERRPVGEAGATAVSCWGIKAPGYEGTIGLSARDRRFRYTQWISPGNKIVAEELYDYEKDPGEARNLAGEMSYRDVVEKRRAVMEEHKEEFFKGSWVQ